MQQFQGQSKLAGHAGLFSRVLVHISLDVDDYVDSFLCADGLLRCPANLLHIFTDDVQIVIYAAVEVYLNIFEQGTDPMSLSKLKSAPSG